MPIHCVLAAGAGGACRLLLGGHAIGVDGVLSEHIDRLRHCTELVAPLSAGDRDRGVAPGELHHRGGDRGQRPRHATREGKGKGKGKGKQHGDDEDATGAED